MSAPAFLASISRSNNWIARLSLSRAASHNMFHLALQALGRRNRRDVHLRPHESLDFSVQLKRVPDVLSGALVRGPLPQGGHRNSHVPITIPRTNSSSKTGQRMDVKIGR